MSFAFQFKVNPVAGSDPDPNATPPSAGRIYPNHDNAKGLSVFCGLAGPAGCTAVITIWYLDSTSNLWWACGTSQTASLAITTNPVVVPSGASFFVQVGAVVNAPTDLYIQIEDFPTTSFSQTAIPAGGSASASNQTSGAQKTQVVDGSGNVSPSGDTAGRAGFVKVTDGTNTSTVKAASTAAAFTDPAAVVELRPGGAFPAKGAATTAGSIPVNVASDQIVPVRTTLASAVTDVAQQSITTKAALTSLAVTNELWVQSDSTNSTAARLGPDATVAIARGIQIAPGDTLIFKVTNANVLSAIAESGTVKLNIIAF